MAKGVKKIKHSEGLYYPNMSVVGSRITIKPDQFAWFEIAEWEAGTTVEDKKKPITWIRQSNDRKVIINQISVPSTHKYGVKLPKKLCGSYHYYIEASLSGKRDFNKKTGIYVKGWCQPKIVSSKWCTQKGGDDVRKTYTFSYGHIIYLYLDTEGLNGDKVTVDVFKVVEGGGGAKDDRLIHTYTNVEVINGQINLKIGNSSLWYGKIGNPKAKEEFYVKVKTASGKYVSDGKDTIHARFLRIKNEVVSKAIEPSTNNTPTKVYKPDVNAARYEPCKFEVVKITESEVKDGKANNTTVTVFDNGKGLKKKPGTLPQEKIERTIFFKFDSTIIDKDGEAVLNNILKFLLEHKGATMNLSGYACVIGRQNYNKGLSQRRADVVKKFFADGGLEAGRIISVGRGEVDPTDDKQGRDNIKYRNEYSYEQNRRVDISFVFYAHDAQTIVYEVIAPSVDTKKELTIDIVGQEAKACFRAKDKHTKETWIVDVGQAIDKGDTKQTFTTPSFNYGVYSPLSRYNPVGGIGFDTDALKIMQYIWPASSSPNQFHLHVHSCRWFSEKKNSTVLIKAYPDIKWKFAFFINLSNSLSIKWQKLSTVKHAELRGKALKLANEEKGKYTEVDFGVELKASFDKQKDGSYHSNPELTAKYSDKIQKLFSTISSIKKIAQGITGKTKGKVSQGIGRKLPFSLSLNAPAFYFGAEWEADLNEIRNDVGTKLRIFLEAKPLVELAIVFDLLSLAIQAGVAAATAGSGNALALEIFNMVRDWAEKGYETEKVEIKFKMYIDLEVKGKVDGSADVTYSTINDGKEVNFSLTSNITVELKSGLELKGMFVVIGTTKKPELEGHAEGKLSAGASMGITSGHQLQYDSNQGIYYIPNLKIDPCVGTVIVMVKAGFTYKKVSSDWTPVNYNRTRTFFNGFDIMKSLAEITGHENKLLLWEKKKK